jgi:F-type H+-transporting ATPase subunit gamma
MPGIKELKTRIKSIGSTRKITRAMQMVSAVKMRKTQNAAISSRTYSTLAWELITNLSLKIESNHPLLVSYPKAKKIGILLLGTNRTLVGSLNSNLRTKLLELKKSGLPYSNHQEIVSEVVVYGRQAKKVAQMSGQQVLADFTKEDKILSSEEIYPLSKYVTDLYVSGEYKAIYIVYNHFVSTLVQKPTIKMLLPFLESDRKSDSLELPESEAADQEKFESEYLFEPSPKTVLEHLVPRIIESQLYQTILESDASEHSARMVMMKNATEAAGDLINNLTLTFNQLRQGKITTELAEITAGKIALE